MTVAKFRKYHSNSSFLTLLLTIVVVVSSDAKAENIGYFASVPDDESLVQNITYKYELINDAGNRPDCVGILSLSMSALADVDAFVLERTLPRILDTENMHFMVKSAFPGNTTNLDISDIYWGTYFRIRVDFADGTRKYSPTYSVNEYIDGEDLESVMKQSSMECVDTGNVSVEIKDKTLFIQTSDTMRIFIYDLYGKELFNGDINHSMTIPLDNIKSQIVIIKYKGVNITGIKKFLIR